MTRRPSPSGWSLAQRRLHWWVAGLVIANLILGVLMVALPFSALAAKFLGYQLHKSLGLVVFGLVLWRLALLWRRGRPHGEGGWAAMLGHGALYGLLFLMPVAGYLTAASAPGGVDTTIFLIIPVPHVVGEDAGRFAVMRWLHGAGAVMLVALVVGHAAMAIQRHRAGSRILLRMWRG